MTLALALAAASCIWLAALAAAAFLGDGVFASGVRTFASMVCHQQLDRSFVWADASWPVCARCLGLYAAAPVGALLALMRPNRSAFDARRNLRVLALAAAPTLFTWLAEFVAGVPITNVTRFAAALPLGAAIAWLLVRTALDARDRGVSQYTLTDARRGPTR